MIKILIETYPSTHRLQRLIKSDIEELLTPEAPLIGTDEIIFE